MKISVSQKIFYLLTVFLFLSVLGCTEKEVEPTAVVSVTLDATSMELWEGESYTLTATISPSNADNQKIIWASSNISIASVKEGVVTALKAGNATITAKSDDGGKTATCEVAVNARIYPVESISLDRTSVELTEGDEITLNSMVKPDNATNKNVTWSSSDPSVAKVVDGNVTALAPGNATITVKTDDGGKIATCEVTVNVKVYPVESISLDRTSVELTEGDEITLNSMVKPDNATNKNVTWSSSDPSVAKVVDGNVTALAPGSATISVKTDDGDKTATCEVTVNARIYLVERVYLDKYYLYLTEGDETTLSATVKPDNATNKNITWNSSDPSVAKVVDGKVTALAAGSATITVKPDDGGKSTTCNVKVWAKAEATSDYVDEYGINHGRGVVIRGHVWAPVNCGYHATDYKYGKLYQWGRKYGQGDEGTLYDGNKNELGIYSDASVPSVVSGPVSLSEGQTTSNSNKFYTSTSSNACDWVTPHNGALWNSGTEENPVKTDYDPCPEGWRVPTELEFGSLCENCSSWTINDGMIGIWLSGPNTYSESVSRVFCPLAGRRSYNGVLASNRGYIGYYWSSSAGGTDKALYIHVQDGDVYAGTYSRANGCSVRCVQE